MSQIITREQLYQRYLAKQEEINKNLQQDIEKIQQEIIYKNDMGKTRVMMAYHASANENGYLDVLVKRVQCVFVDSTITVNAANEIIVDWTFPLPSSTY
jgi:peptidoglycan hydrolase CwlO-like protein